MEKRTAIQLVLFAVLGISLASWAVKNFPAGGTRPGASKAAFEAPSAAAAGESSPAGRAEPDRPLADGLAVINFHGTRR